MTEKESRGFDVFISHSTKDAAAAALIKHQLEACGLRCWKAPDDILPGESWPSAIMRALGMCRSMVLVWSSHSMSSHEVPKELTLAMKNGVVVIPFRLEDVEPSGEWAYHLANTHWMDAFPGALEPYVSELAQRLFALLEPGAADSPRPADAIQQAPRRVRTAKWLVPASVLAAVGVGLAALAIYWGMGTAAGGKNPPLARQSPQPPPPVNAQAAAPSQPIAVATPNQQELAALRDKVEMVRKEAELRDEARKAEQSAAESRRLAAEREAELLRKQAEQAEREKQDALKKAAHAEEEAATARNLAVIAEIPLVVQRSNSGLWLFPDSSVRPLTMEDLAGLDADDLWRARNEIFARRGLIFQSERGRRFARQLGSSYRPVSANQEAIVRSMNPVEQRNVELIESLEKGL